MIIRDRQSSFFLRLGRLSLAALHHPRARRFAIGQHMQDAYAWLLAAQQHQGLHHVGSGDKQLKMIIAGDSIAAGLGLDDFKDSVGGRLAQDWAAALGASLVCENRACHGASVADLAAQLTGVTADLAFVTIGTRDAISATPLPAFKASLERALASLAGAQQVFVLGCGNVEDVPALPRLFHPLGRRRCRVYNGAISEVMAAHPQARLIRLDSLEPTRDHFAVDGYHPSHAGHVLIYAQVAKSLE